MNIFKILILFLISLLVGCATDIDYKIPAHRFMDPETRGTSVFDKEFGGYVQTSYQSDHKLTMTEVFDLGVFGTRTYDNPVLERTTNFGLQAGLGIVSNFDLMIRQNGDSPTLVLGKFQVFGGSSKDANEGAKVSLWFGVGSMEEDEGNLVVTSGGTSRTYSGNIEVYPWEFGTSVGYRFSPIAIVYLNGVYSKYPSKSTLTSTVNPTVNVKGDALLQALTLGVKLGSNQGVSCHIEAGASKVEWDGTVDTEQSIGTAAVAFSLEI